MMVFYFILSASALRLKLHNIREALLTFFELVSCFEKATRAVKKTTVKQKNVCLSTSVHYLFKKRKPLKKSTALTIFQWRYCQIKCLTMKLLRNVFVQKRIHKVVFVFQPHLLDQLPALIAAYPPLPKTPRSFLSTAVATLQLLRGSCSSRGNTGDLLHHQFKPVNLFRTEDSTTILFQTISS